MASSDVVPTAPLIGEAVPQFEVGDVDKLHVIGKGAKSKVWLSKLRRTGEIFALKEIPRQAIQYKQEAEHVWNERHVLTVLSRESFVRCCHLKGTMKDDCALYFLLEFVPGAPLHQHFRAERGFSERRARFYCAELVETLGELHRRGIIYRDLKASNVMLDARSGRLRLVDFGFAKLLAGRDDDVPHLRRTTSVCGTAHAMAPEVHAAADAGQEPSEDSVHESIGYTAAADWWSLGVLAFEMLTASAPFGYLDGDRGAPICELAAASPKGLDFPESSSEAFRDFVSRLLTPAPSERLGHGGADEVRRHRWFDGFDWSLAAPGRALEPLVSASGGGLDDLEDDVPLVPEAQLDGPPSFDRTLGEFASSDRMVIGQEVEGDPFDDF